MQWSSRILSSSNDKKALLITIASFGVLSAFRAYDYWVTGFFVADEVGYYVDAVTGASYGYRWFYSGWNTAIFRLFGIHGVTAYWLFLPFYLFAWAAVTTFTFYKIMKLLEFDEWTIVVSLFSSLFLVSFVLLSLGFLTEPVGLGFAMLGIYFMLKCAKRIRKADWKIVLFSLMSALFFVAAEGTREPYEIFSVGGAVLIPLIMIVNLKLLTSSGKARGDILAVAAIALFVIPTGVFMVYPTNIWAAQVAPTTEGLVGNIGAPSSPIVMPPIKITITTVTTVTTTTTSTQVVSTGGQVQTTIVTATITSTQTTTTEAAPRHPNFLAQTRFGNTLLIFIGGLVLGWGPILFIVGLVGFLILLARMRRRDPMNWLVFGLVLLALGSYFVVSFIFSTDPFYLTFTNYSTVIRFSDTALPAYFLLAPFALTFAAKKKTHAAAVLAVLVIFLLVAIPTYEVYASSSLTTYTGSNPFSLGFRTDAVLVRDYISANPSAAPFNIIGYPGDWGFTPGTDTMQSVSFYSPVSLSGVPQITQADFLSHRWTSFYIYVAGTTQSLGANSTYLVQMIRPTTNATVSGGNPYAVISNQVVLQGSDFKLYHVQLVWP